MMCRLALAAVNFIDSNVTMKGRPEVELLFAPYSVFCVKEVSWSKSPAQEPHLIHLDVAEDNLWARPDLPLSSWN